MPSLGRRPTPTKVHCDRSRSLWGRIRRWCRWWRKNSKAARRDNPFDCLDLENATSDSLQQEAGWLPWLQWQASARVLRAAAGAAHGRHQRRASCTRPWLRDRSRREPACNGVPSRPHLHARLAARAAESQPHVVLFNPPPIGPAAAAQKSIPASTSASPHFSWERGARPTKGSPRKRARDMG